MKEKKYPTRGKHARIRAFKEIVSAVQQLNRTDRDLVAKAVVICFAK